MKGRGGPLAWTAVAALAMAMVAVAVLGANEEAASSALSRGPTGWLAARRYLEERGTRVQLLDRDLDGARERGVLVLAFPFQQVFGPPLDDAVLRHLHRGGNVLLAYTDRGDPRQRELLKALGLESEERRPRAPLRPLAWRRYAAEEWTLHAPGGSSRPARIGALRRVPAPPTGARVLLEDEQARPVAFVFTRTRGQVAVVPAALLSNARVSEPGNADVLETLRQDLGGEWTFDEFHHGLQAVVGGASGGSTALGLYVAQVAFVYGLCALAVARRFGPAWREPALTRGSAATFLVGLGALHDRLGHHRDAARLLVARARELDPQAAVPEMAARDGKELLQLARHIGRSQTRKGRT